MFASPSDPVETLIGVAAEPTLASRCIKQALDRLNWARGR